MADERFAPLFMPDTYNSQDTWHLSPFFTNLNKSVYVPLIFSPELVGALCSRTSRTAQDLRKIFLSEFIYTFTRPMRGSKETIEVWQEKAAYGRELKDFIEFLHEHSFSKLFSNPRARAFYATWLAQYGDDSIAQMAGLHLVYSGISQLAIKHIEDQRIGLAPIEKSTRYVNYSSKINDRYMYYIDPTLISYGFVAEYRAVMDNLFETYTRLIPKLIIWLTQQFPEEKASVVEKKALDCLRGLLPMSTLSSVAFFGNGQAFEHMINRCGAHSLGEIRWTGQRAMEELNQVVPSFLRRIQDQEKKEMIERHQDYIIGKNRRVDKFARELGGNAFKDKEVCVSLIEYDLRGEDKILTGILFSAPSNHRSWSDILEQVSVMTFEKKRQILSEYFRGREAKWQKVGRALENAYVRFEIVMNAGAWRDLHRHRMLTQQRQNFSCYHGYVVPLEVTQAGLENEYRSAVDLVEGLFSKVAPYNPDLAQYITTMAHHVRFMQWENLRECFWEMELRTIPEGHPDYRSVEQQKFRLLKEVYPLITEYMLVNMGQYDFARRGQEEKIVAKTKRLDTSPS